MKNLDKNISVFLEQQLPSFYLEEGPNFVAFIRAYLEWLEDNNNPYYKSRRLLEYRDIDLTLDAFVQSFVDKYLTGIPDTTILQPSDEEDRKRFLIKHVFDLYRSKGTENGYKLLFRLLFNEDIEVEIPSTFILRPSDAIFVQPAFLEVSTVSGLANIVGKRIIGATSGATALVESLRNYYIEQREVNVLDISDLQGDFSFNEFIFDRDRATFTDALNAPKVTGSMTSFNITSGGENFSVGDVLDVQTNVNGIGGQAVVKSVADTTGSVTFTITDGGSGYKSGTGVTGSTANVTVQAVGPVDNITIVDQGANNNIGDNLTYTSNSITGGAGSNFEATVSAVTESGGITEITITNNGTGYVNTGIFTNSSNTDSTFTLVANIAGSGATFEIGDIADTETISLNTDDVQDFLATELDASDFGFSDSVITDIHTEIGSALNFSVNTIGTIQTLQNITVGSGYKQDPAVKVVQEDIKALGLSDGEGGTKGDNATVNGDASSLTDTVTEVALVSSGFGYNANDAVTMTKTGNPSNVQATINLVKQGTTEGIWRTRRGILDPINKIQDSLFYQEFSYNIKSRRSLDKYKEVAKQVIHPAGVALFGTMEMRDVVDQEVSVALGSVTANT